MPLYVLYVVLRFGFSAQIQEMKTMKFFVQTVTSEKKICLRRDQMSCTGYVTPLDYSIKGSRQTDWYTGQCWEEN